VNENETLVWLATGSILISLSYNALQYQMQLAYEYHQNYIDVPQEDIDGKLKYVRVYLSWIVHIDGYRYHSNID